VYLYYTSESISLPYANVTDMAMPITATQGTDGASPLAAWPPLINSQIVYSAGVEPMRVGYRYLT
jgi:hypothetical protein